MYSRLVGRKERALSRLVGIMIFSLLVFPCPGSLAFARQLSSTFRCGPEVVSIGDTKEEVRIKCGEPTSTEVAAFQEKGFYQDVPNRKRGGKEKGSFLKVSEKVEKWYYNCGAYSFSVTLTFVGTDLETIEQLDYGTGESDCLGASSRRTGYQQKGEGRAGRDKGPDAGLMKRFRNLSERLERPQDELLEEAMKDLLKKYEK